MYVVLLYCSRLILRVIRMGIPLCRWYNSSFRDPFLPLITTTLLSSLGSIPRQHLLPTLPNPLLPHALSPLLGNLRSNSSIRRSRYSSRRTCSNIINMDTHYCRCI